MFWFKEFVSYFKKTARLKIAYVIPNLGFYNTIQPSSRIRVFDVINMLRYSDTFHVSLYNPLLKYNVLIFQKKFDNKAYLFAKKQKKKGVKIILDINVNYYNPNSNIIETQQHKDIIRFTNLCDYIISSSDYISNYINTILPKKNIVTIYESINNKYFKQSKILNNNIRTLIWSGYSVKAKEFLLIKNVLEELYTRYKFKLIIVAEKYINLDIDIPIEFIKYSEKNIVSTLLKGDIFIAPRDMTEEYNLGHSFTKIGVAMALGLPVIASPVPSYLKSPAIFCKNEKEWYNNLSTILAGDFNFKIISKQGIEYCKKYYSYDVIKAEYNNFFQEIIS